MAEVSRTRLGPLGRRLVVAFSLVSLVSVGLLALAAQRAVERGLSVVVAGGRPAVAQGLAGQAAEAYADAGGWSGADLTPVEEAARAYGVGVVIRDSDGDLVLDTSGTAPDQPRSGRGPGAGNGGAGFGVTVPVEEGGSQIGSLTLVAGPAAEVAAETRGRDIAWSWIAGASLVALAIAVLAGWLVTGRLTRPLERLAAVARAYAAGDRGARSEPSGSDEIAEVARAFDDAVESAERSAAQRRQMAADVAHELRTPLAALQAGLEEVRDGLVPADAATLHRLHDQAVRLGRVVGDLALLASPDDTSPGLAERRTDLARVVGEEVAVREPELTTAGITVRQGLLEPVAVLADADRLHQVVGNLLANVARHCRSGDAVEVGVRRVGDLAEVRIADTGPGIAPEHVPRVFDRYWRGPDARMPGSGLGLAVVREIVSAHGGTVEISSPPSGGLTVIVRLPALPERGVP
jgi:two-component system sensor histidine kinase BaeS